MPEKQYPYTGWVLMPSYKPKQETFVREANFFNRDLYGVTEAGKYVSSGEIYASKADAIAAGRARLDEQHEKLKKMQERVNKRHAALDKAAAE